MRLRKEWVLYLSYALKLYSDKIISDLKHMDRLIEHKLHKRAGGSGMGDASRDLTFYYHSEKEAVAGKKIAAGIKGVRDVDLHRLTSLFGS